MIILYPWLRLRSIGKSSVGLVDWRCHQNTSVKLGLVVPPQTKRIFFKLNILIVKNVILPSEQVHIWKRILKVSIQMDQGVLNWCIMVYLGPARNTPWSALWLIIHNMMNIREPKKWSLTAKKASLQVHKVIKEKKWSLTAFTSGDSFTAIQNVFHNGTKKNKQMGTKSQSV